MHAAAIKLCSHCRPWFAVSLPSTAYRLPLLRAVLWQFEKLLDLKILRRRLAQYQAGVHAAGTTVGALAVRSRCQQRSVQFWQNRRANRKALSENRYVRLKGAESGTGGQSCLNFVGGWTSIAQKFSGD
jgi:hypothetical protein